MKVRKALGEGVKEIWLTAQDGGCYGFDLGTNLPELLKELVMLDYDFKIRVGMMNPDHLLKMKNEMLELFKSEKIYKFLHLPVQSGNDQVLKMMGRQYSIKEFVDLVKEFRANFPEITIATDMIVGFPGETDRQYWDTLSVVRQMSPEVMNISRFWAREKTAAAKMKNQIPGDEIKRRSRVLSEIFRNIARLNNEKWLGKIVEIMLVEKGKNEQWIGRNQSYKPVIVEGDFKLGQKLRVKINKINQWDLQGQIL